MSLEAYIPIWSCNPLPSTCSGRHRTLVLHQACGCCQFYVIVSNVQKKKISCKITYNEMLSCSSGSMNATATRTHIPHFWYICLTKSATYKSPFSFTSLTSISVMCTNGSDHLLSLNLGWRIFHVPSFCEFLVHAPPRFRLLLVPLAS